MFLYFADRYEHQQGEKTQPEEKYKFVDKPSKKFYCPILFDLLLKPHLTECCGNHLSESAAQRLKNDKCPLCKCEVLKTMLDLNFQKQVQELPVFCSNRARGCGWVAELSRFESHMESCLKASSPIGNHELGNSITALFHYHSISVFSLYDLYYIYIFVA